MPRKTRRPPPFVLTSHAASRSRFPHWLGYLLTALVAAVLGWGVTYLYGHKHTQDLQAELNQAKAQLIAMSPAGGTPSGPATAPGVPPADLTAGLDAPHAAKNLGDWYEDREDWAKAIANYSVAISGGLDDPDIRTDLGVAYFRSGQPQKALDQYRNAHAKDPNHENSLFNQGAAYAQLGQASKAVTAWQDYLDRFPQGQHVADARQLIAEVKAHGLPQSASGSALPQ
jgi:tetratricopeptide (TPR) repeat protein